MNKIFITVFLVVSGSLMISADFVRSNLAPGGSTGAEGTTCIGCHPGNPLNAAEGSVTINGLPAIYTPGTTYNNISVTIVHKDADRSRWGFAMKAVANGSAAGTFTENNPNIYINTQFREVGHQNAPFTNPSKSYTFSNISWTAPVNPTQAEQTITFFVAANAVGNNGDFIYASSLTTTLNTSSVSERSLPVENLKIIVNGKDIRLQLNITKPTPLKTVILSPNGQKMLETTEKKYTTGNQNITITGSHLPSGTYILLLENGSGRISRKITLQ